MNLTETAYERLRKLHDKYKLGNNYILTVLLENYDELIDREKETIVFNRFMAKYGAPTGDMK